MKTLIIDGNALLDWIADHDQVWEDMLRHFNPKELNYDRVMVTSSEYCPIEEGENRRKWSF